MPQSFIERHPFHGPGLAIRCPGEITREKIEILRVADSVYIDQIRKHGLYNNIWQAFVALLPVKTVGVNSVGLIRRGYTDDQVREIEDVYRVLYVQNSNVSKGISSIKSSIIDSDIRKEIL